MLNILLCVSAEPGVGLKIDEIAKLNKTRPGVDFSQIEGSDPNDPTYAATLESFHQIHCLVCHLLSLFAPILPCSLTDLLTNRASSARRPGR